MNREALSNEVIEPEELERIVELHGHMRPGLALGTKVAPIALADPPWPIRPGKIAPMAQGEGVVATAETDMRAGAGAGRVQSRLRDPE